MKKIIAFITILVNIFLYSNIFAASIPTVSISGPNTREVKIGGTIKYTVTFYNTSSINLKPSDIGIAGSGVTANKSIEGTGNVRTIVLSNIQGPIGQIVSIAIKGGVAKNDYGYSQQTGNSVYFKLISGNYDATKPSIMISGPSLTNVNQGDSLSYTINYSDNSGNVNVLLNSSHIRLYGFSANINISGSQNKRVVTLSNIRGNAGGNKYIALSSGTARDNAGNNCNGVSQTSSFSINQTTNSGSSSTNKPSSGSNNNPSKPGSNQTTNSLVDETKPLIKVTLSDTNTVKETESYKFTVDIEDNDSNLTILMDASTIKLEGFTADIIVNGEGNKREVELANIKGEKDVHRTIEFLEGIAIDSKGNKSENLKTDLKLIIEPKPDNKYEDGRPNDWVPNPNTGKR